MFYALNSFCTIILTFDYDDSVMVCYCVGVSYISISTKSMIKCERKVGKLREMTIWIWYKL